MRVTYEANTFICFFERGNTIAPETIDIILIIKYILAHNLSIPIMKNIFNKHITTLFVSQSYSMCYKIKQRDGNRKNVHRSNRMRQPLRFSVFFKDTTWKKLLFEF